MGLPPISNRLQHFNWIGCFPNCIGYDKFKKERVMAPMKKVRITFNRKDKQEEMNEAAVPEVVKNEEVPFGEPKEETKLDSVLSEEDQYAKELEPVLEEYISFAQTYKKISKQMMNPIKMRKNAGNIYQQLSKMSEGFNKVIANFKEQAVPPEDLQEIHEKMIESLNYFEVYNNEFPTLMKSGNFKRINEVSKGLDKGHRGIKEVFAQLEEREAQKTK